MHALIDVLDLGDEPMRASYHAATDSHPQFVALRIGFDLTVHLQTAEQARALVAVATEAARLLSHCAKCGGQMPGHTMTCTDRHLQSDEVAPEIAVSA